MFPGKVLTRLERLTANPYENQRALRVARWLAGRHRGGDRASQIGEALYCWRQTPGQRTSLQACFTHALGIVGEVCGRHLSLMPRRSLSSDRVPTWTARLHTNRTSLGLPLTGEQDRFTNAKYASQEHCRCFILPLQRRRIVNFSVTRW